MLPLDEKFVLGNILYALLVEFGYNKLTFWQQLNTVEEPWIHNNTRENKTVITEECDGGLDR